MGRGAHLSRGNNHLNLTTSSAHQLAKLGAHTRQQAQAVVLSKSSQKVLDSLARDASALRELGNNGRLVGGGEGRGLEDADELGVLREEVGEGSHAFGGGLEGGGLDGGSVLLWRQNQNDAAC